MTLPTDETTMFDLWRIAKSTPMTPATDRLPADFHVLREWVRAAEPHLGETGAVLTGTNIGGLHVELWRRLWIAFGHHDVTITLCTTGGGNPRVLYRYGGASPCECDGPWWPWVEQAWAEIRAAREWWLTDRAAGAFRREVVLIAARRRIAQVT